MAVTDKAIVRIKEMIISGELAPGQRLPPEKELSERLGLSRNSLREAVKGLELIRVLDVRQGDGTYVTSLEPDMLLEVTSFVADLHRDQSIIEIFEVRRVLEAHATSLAADIISDDGLRQLQLMIDEVDESTEIERLVAHDLDFHRMISVSCGNAYLASMLERLSGETIRARVWRGITEAGSVARTLEEHQIILTALMNRDSALAALSAAAHVAGIESWIRKALT